MRRILKRGRPSPAMVVAILALIVALGGSAYAASKINGSLVKKNSLPGNRIKSNTVTGKQVKESSLGTVRRATNATNATNAANAATLAGASLDSLTVGRSNVSGTTGSNCDPSTTGFVDCGTVTLNLPRQGRVFVDAHAQFDGNNSGSGYVGLCRLTVDGSVFGPTISSGNSDGFGVGFNGNDEGSNGLTAVTGVLPGGAHDIALTCNQQGGSIEYRETMISALAIGAG